MHLTNKSFPGCSVDSLNEVKIFHLLNLLQVLTFDCRVSFAVEKHGDRLSFVDAHGLGGGEETKGIELFL